MCRCKNTIKSQNKHRSVLSTGYLHKIQHNIAKEYVKYIFTDNSFSYEMAVSFKHSLYDKDNTLNMMITLITNRYQTPGLNLVWNFPAQASLLHFIIPKTLYRVYRTVTYLKLGWIQHNVCWNLSKKYNHRVTYNVDDYLKYDFTIDITLIEVPRNLTEGIRSLFDHCVNAMGQQPYWSSYHTWLQDDCHTRSPL